MTHRQQGYSLAEMLVVVAIIGIISLVAVPNFMSMYKSSKVKTSFRQLATDMRTARQRAITEFRQTKLSFDTGTTQHSYSIWKNENGTWVRQGAERQLDPDVYFSDTTFTDKNSDGLSDIIFLNSGGIDPISPTPTEYSVTIRSAANLPVNQYKLTFGLAGNFKSEGAKWN